MVFPSFHSSLFSGFSIVQVFFVPYLTSENSLVLKTIDGIGLLNIGVGGMETFGSVNTKTDLLFHSCMFYYKFPVSKTKKTSLSNKVTRVGK